MEQALNIKKKEKSSLDSSIAHFLLCLHKYIVTKDSRTAQILVCVGGDKTREAGNVIKECLDLQTQLKKK